MRSSTGSAALSSETAHDLPVVSETLRSAAREFKFHLCQYILDTETGVFKAGTVKLGDTLRDLTQHAHGLNKLEVLDRRAMVGPNEVKLRQPSLLTRCWIQQDLLRLPEPHGMDLASLWRGVAVAWYSYLNEKSLASLTKIEGRIMTRRDGQWVSTDYHELVPVLISNPAVADEASLTPLRPPAPS
eukprot:g17620.t1